MTMSPPLAVGTRVRVKGTPHEPDQDTGTVAVIDPGPAYGIKFDAGADDEDDEMAGEIHRWYVGQELEPEGAQRGMGDTTRARMGSTDMKDTKGMADMVTIDGEDMPLDSAENCRKAWQALHAGEHDPDEMAEAMAKIRAAGREYGVEFEEMMRSADGGELRRQMSSASINDLPDSAFAYIEPGGEKDEQGKTVPRSLRHFPIHDACLVAGTMIPLLDGRTVAIEDLVGVAEFWVYAFDAETRSVVPGRAHSARETMTTPIVAHVRLDNGEVVQTTPDHRFMLRSGDYRQAQDLAPGDSLMPLRRKAYATRANRTTGQKGKEYEFIFQPFYRFWELTHHAVDRYAHGFLVDGNVVHHRNDDQFDNRPENLEQMSRATHCSHHGEANGWKHIEQLQQGSRRRWSDPTARERQAAHRRRLNEEMKAAGILPTKPVSPWCATRESAAAIHARYVGGESIRSLARELGVSESGIKLGFCRYGLLSRRKLATVNNHKVVSVTFHDGDPQPVYDISVDELHNFAVAAGVFVHNSHVRNALARASQSPFGDKAMSKIRAAAKKMGVHVSASGGRLSMFLGETRRLFEFDEALHPRDPKGSTTGGQFTTNPKSATKTSPKKTTRKTGRRQPGTQGTGSGVMSYNPATGRGTGYGMAGGDLRVRRLQEALNRLGITDSRGRKLKVDGKLGPLTTQAVRAAQRRMGIKADGRVTADMLDSLGKTKSLPRKSKSSKCICRSVECIDDRCDDADAEYRRALPTVCTRAFQFDQRSSGDGRTLDGYVAVFGQVARIADHGGDFEEEIHRGAFDKSLQRSLPVMQFDHGRDPRTGTVPIGVYEVFEPDHKGYRVRGRLLDNPVVEPVRQAIEAGAIRGMSWRMQVPKSGEKWDRRYGQPDKRNVLEADVPEAGPVVFPAYNATTVSVRSFLSTLDVEARRALIHELWDELRAAYDLSELRDTGRDPDLTGRPTGDVGGGDPDLEPQERAGPDLPNETAATRHRELLITGVIR